jgi:hypothetical protein
MRSLVTTPAGRAPSSRLQRRAAGVAAVLALVSSGAAAEGPACIAAAEIVPAEAFVGQQLLYRLTILARDDVRSVDWIVPPRFPGFRAERLPGRPQTGVVERSGVRYRTREEHRALYAEQPGEHRIRLAGIRCEVGDGTAARSIEAEVPEARVTVRALPSEGAPNSFSGVVGPVALRARIDPTHLVLGGTLHLEVSLQGAGNLWDAPDPLPPAAFDSAASRVEVFRRRPELLLEPGSRLTVRRIFRYDIVPDTPGPLVIPPLGLDVFDPFSETYRRVTSQGSTLNVAPNSPRPRVDPPGARSTTAPLVEDASDGVRWHGALAGLAVVVGAGVWGALRARRRPSTAQLALATLRSTDPSEVDAAALARALRSALAGRSQDGDSSLEAILAAAGPSGPVAEAAALLDDLELVRFQPGSTPPDRLAVEAALERLG